MNFLKQHARTLLSISTALCCAMFAGCETSSITVHEGVPVTRKTQKKNTEPIYRMVAAIAEQPSGTWFFKLSGPIANVEELNAPWRKFLESIGFDNNEPIWDLPQGWNSKGLENRPMPGGSSMRIANIDTGDQEIALSVTSMPAGQQLLPNVNRWRGQLGLQPISQIDMASQLSDLETETLSYKVFETDGPELTTRMGGRPPFAGPRGRQPQSVGPGHPPIERADTSDKSPKTDDEETPLEFERPNGWIEGSTSSMVLARLSKDISGQPAEMLLLRMKPSEESWNNNIVAWTKEVGANAPSESESIKVAGIESRKIRIAGPAEEDSANRAVLAVMFASPSGDGFVLKLSGPDKAVESAEPDFQAFLDSIRFSKPKSAQPKGAKPKG